MTRALARRAWGRLAGLDARVVDGLLVGVLTAAVTVEFVLSGRPWIRFPALLVTTVPLLWRRRFPIAAYLVQSAGLFLWLAPPLVTSLVAVFLGVYSMSLYSRHRRGSLAIPLAQSALLAGIGIPLDFNTPAVPAWLAELAGGVGMWLAGDSVRGLRERARRLERERELVTRIAVAEEQARIARDLHDIVAHSVSIMVVQAGAARRLLTASPERAAEALQTVEASGREALGELRQMLGVLGDGDGQAALAPQPGLGQLDLLVERLRATGNAAGTAPGPPPAQRGGRGLAGMRQRVALHGGELDAGPLTAGGFAVRARLPLREPAADVR